MAKKKRFFDSVPPKNRPKKGCPAPKPNKKYKK
jgi:hypothetical protein